MNPVRVERADIQTCTIEVRVVKIDRRQMTLSVFNQIPHEPIIDPATLQPRGEPWGLVRHRGEWILWQKGGELRTCRLNPDAACDDPDPWWGDYFGRNLRLGQHERVHQAYRVFESLGQLFIAV